MSLSRTARSVIRALRHRGPFRLGVQALRVLATEGPWGITRRMAAHHQPALPLTDPGADPCACVIVTTPHVAHVAQMMADVLGEHGYRAQIAHDTAGTEGFAHVFVLCPQMFAAVPPHYVAFQMEQSVSSRWFTPDYLARLAAARAVLDYSAGNIAFLRDRGLALDRLFHVPLDTDPTRPLSGAARQGVLFYGDPTSPRRRRMLADLKARIPELQVESTLFGPDLTERLDRTAVVLNIHYHDGALLETTRINQALSHGVQVVSEGGADADRHGDLAGVVDFAPMGDIGTLVQLVRRALDDPEHAAARHKAAAAHARRADNRFRAGFRRFLLAQDMIPQADFDAAVPGWGGPVPTRPHLCLTLPETPERQAAFTAQGERGFCFWPGLRGRPGWKGAARSHAQICRRLLACGVDEAVICEDDVIFPADFDARMAAVRRYLDVHPGWEMFSGLIADAAPDWPVLHADRTEGITFAHLDRSVSMVFNILRRPVMEHLAAWDERDDDAFANTIDRWLARRPTRVVVALPFLVGHRDGSTLRHASITQYDRLAGRSERLLMDKAARV